MPSPFDFRRNPGLNDCAEGAPDPVALAVANEVDAERIFQALARDGQVLVPLCRTFFATRFGIVTDCHGVAWIVTASP